MSSTPVNNNCELKGNIYTLRPGATEQCNDDAGVAGSPLSEGRDPKPVYIPITSNPNVPASGANQFDTETVFIGQLFGATDKIPSLMFYAGAGKTPFILQQTDIAKGKEDSNIKELILMVNQAVYGENASEASPEKDGYTLSAETMQKVNNSPAARQAVVDRLSLRAEVDPEIYLQFLLGSIPPTMYYVGSIMPELDREKILMTLVSEINAELNPGKEEQNYILSAEAVLKIEQKPALKRAVIARLEDRSDALNGVDKEPPPAVNIEADPRLRLYDNDHSLRDSLVFKGVRELTIRLSKNRQGDIVGYTVLIGGMSDNHPIAYYRRPESGQPEIFEVFDQSAMAEVRAMQRVLAPVTEMGKLSYTPGKPDLSTAQALQAYFEIPRIPVNVDLDYEKLQLRDNEQAAKRSYGKLQQLKTKGRHLPYKIKQNVLFAAVDAYMRVSEKAHGLLAMYAAADNEETKATNRALYDAVQDWKRIAKDYDAKLMLLADELFFNSPEAKAEYLERAKKDKDKLPPGINDFLGWLQLDLDSIGVEQDKHTKAERSGNKKKTYEITSAIRDKLIRYKSLLEKYQRLFPDAADAGSPIFDYCRIALEQIKPLIEHFLPGYPAVNNPHSQDTYNAVDGEYQQDLYLLGTREREGLETIKIRHQRAAQISENIGNDPSREVVFRFLADAYRKGEKLGVSVPKLLSVLIRTTTNKDTFTENVLLKWGRGRLESSKYQERGIADDAIGDIINEQSSDDSESQIEEAITRVIDPKEQEFTESLVMRRHVVNLMFNLYQLIEEYNLAARAEGRPEVSFRSIAAKFNQLSTLLQGAPDEEFGKTFELLTNVSTEDSALATQQLSVNLKREVARYRHETWRRATVSLEDGKTQSAFLKDARSTKLVDAKGISYNLTVSSVESQTYLLSSLEMMSQKIEGDTVVITLASGKKINLKKDFKPVTLSVEDIRLIDRKDGKITISLFNGKAIVDVPELTITLFSVRKRQDHPQSVSIALAKVQTLSFEAMPKVAIDGELVFDARVAKDALQRNVDASVPARAVPYDVIVQGLVPGDPEKGRQLAAARGLEPGKYYLASNGRYEEVKADEKGKVALEEVSGRVISENRTSFTASRPLAALNLHMIGYGYPVTGEVLLQTALADEHRTPPVVNYFTYVSMGTAGEVFSLGRHYFTGSDSSKIYQYKFQSLLGLKVLLRNPLLSQESKAIMLKLSRGYSDRYFTGEEKGALKKLIQELSAKKNQIRLIPEDLALLDQLLATLATAIARMEEKAGISAEQAVQFQKMAQIMRRNPKAVITPASLEFNPQLYEERKHQDPVLQKLRDNVAPSDRAAFIACYIELMPLLRDLHAQIEVKTALNPAEEFNVGGKIERHFIHSWKKFAKSAWETGSPTASFQERQETYLPDGVMTAVKAMAHPELSRELSELSARMDANAEEIRRLVRSKESKKLLQIDEFQALSRKITELKVRLHNRVLALQKIYLELSKDRQTEEERTTIMWYYQALSNLDSQMGSIQEYFKKGGEDPFVMVRYLEDGIRSSKRMELELAGLLEAYQGHIKSDGTQEDRQIVAELQALLPQATATTKALNDVVENQTNGFKKLFETRNSDSIRMQEVWQILSAEELTSEEWATLRNLLGNGILSGSAGAKVHAWFRSLFGGKIEVLGQNGRVTHEAPLALIDRHFGVELRGGRYVAVKHVIERLSATHLDGNFERTKVLVTFKKLISIIPIKHSLSPSAIVFAAVMGRRRFGGPLNLVRDGSAAVERVLMPSFEVGPGSIPEIMEAANSQTALDVNALLGYLSGSSDQMPPQNISKLIAQLLQRSADGRAYNQKRFGGYMTAKHNPQEYIDAEGIRLFIQYVRTLLPTICENEELRANLSLYAGPSGKIDPRWANLAAHQAEIEAELTLIETELGNDAAGEMKIMSDESRISLTHSARATARVRLARLASDVSMIEGEFYRTVGIRDIKDQQAAVQHPNDKLSALRSEQADGAKLRQLNEVRVVEYDPDANGLKDGELVRLDFAGITLNSPYQWRKDISHWSDAQINRLREELAKSTVDGAALLRRLGQEALAYGKSYGHTFISFAWLMERNIGLGFMQVGKALGDYLMAMINDDRAGMNASFERIKEGLLMTAGSFLVYETFTFLLLKECQTDIEKGEYGLAFGKLHYLYTKMIKGHMQKAWDNSIKIAQHSVVKNFVHLYRNRSALGHALSFKKGSLAKLRKFLRESPLLGEDVGTGYKLAHYMLSPFGWLDIAKKLGIKVEKLWLRGRGSAGLRVGFVPSLKTEGAVNTTGPTNRPNLTMYDRAVYTAENAKFGLNEVYDAVTDAVDGGRRRVGLVTLVAENFRTGSVAEPVAVSFQGELDAAGTVSRVLADEGSLVSVENTRSIGGTEAVRTNSTHFDRGTFLRLLDAACRGDEKEFYSILKEFNRQTHGAKYTRSANTNHKTLYETFRTDLNPGQTLAAKVQAAVASGKSLYVSPTEAMLKSWQTDPESFKRTHKFTVNLGDRVNVRLMDITLNELELRQILAGKRVLGLSEELCQELAQRLRAGVDPHQIRRALANSERLVRRLSPTTVFELSRVDVAKSFTDRLSGKVRGDVLLEYGRQWSDIGIMTVDANPDAIRNPEAAARRLNALLRNNEALINEKGATRAIIRTNGIYIEYEVNGQTVYEELKFNKRGQVKAAGRGALRGFGPALMFSTVFTVGEQLVDGRSLREIIINPDTYKKIGMGVIIGSAWGGVEEAAINIGLRRLRVGGSLGGAVGFGVGVIGNWDKFMMGWKDGDRWLEAIAVGDAVIEGLSGAAGATTFYLISTPSGGVLAPIAGIAASTAVHGLTRSALRLIADRSKFTHETKALFRQAGITLQLASIERNKGLYEYNEKLGQPDGDKLLYVNLHDQEYLAKLSDSGISALSADTTTDINPTTLDYVLAEVAQLKAAKLVPEGKKVAVEITDYHLRTLRNGYVYASYKLKFSVDGKTIEPMPGKKQDHLQINIFVEGDPVKGAKLLHFQQARREVGIMDLMLLEAGLPYDQIDQYPKIKAQLDFILPPNLNGESYEQRVNLYLADMAELPQFRDEFTQQSIHARYTRGQGVLSAFEVYHLLVSTEEISEGDFKDRMVEMRKKAGLIVPAANKERVAIALIYLAQQLVQGKAWTKLSPAIKYDEMQTSIFDNQVFTVQIALNKLGLLKSEDVDGHYNEATVSAIAIITGSGEEITPAVLTAIAKKIVDTIKKERPAEPAPERPKQPFSVNVFSFQGRLSRLGLLSRANVTGHFDEVTKKACEKFYFDFTRQPDEKLKETANEVFYYMSFYVGQEWSAYLKEIDPSHHNDTPAPPASISQAGVVTIDQRELQARRSLHQWRTDESKEDRKASELSPSDRLGSIMQVRGIRHFYIDAAAVQINDDDKESLKQVVLMTLKPNDTFDKIYLMARQGNVFKLKFVDSRNKKEVIWYLQASATHKAKLKSSAGYTINNPNDLNERQWLDKLTGF